MSQKIQAARRAAGLIILDGQSDEQVKAALEKVSTIKGIEGNELSFEGQRIIEGHGYNLTVNCFDIFECPNGYLLQVYMDDAPNWTVVSKTISKLLRATPDKAVARRAHGELVKKGLASIHEKF